MTETQDVQTPRRSQFLVGQHLMGKPRCLSPSTRLSASILRRVHPASSEHPGIDRGVQKQAIISEKAVVRMSRDCWRHISLSWGISSILTPCTSIPSRISAGVQPPYSAMSRSQSRDISLANRTTRIQSVVGMRHDSEELLRYSAAVKVTMEAKWVNARFRRDSTWYFTLRRRIPLRISNVVFAGNG
jgi:hypothetical protein